MTEEEKSLLLKDLCTRLPYGVKVYCGEGLAMTLKQIDYNCFCECWENEDIKSHSRWKLPYLRPLSSMTEEEKDTYDTLTMCNAPWVVNDWLNKNMFDYRGLISMGLALEAPKDMYNIK